MIRPEDRERKCVRSFDGLPSLEKSAEWETDLHRMAICNIKEMIAECGDTFLSGLESDARKEMFRNAVTEEKKKDPYADPRTWTARAVLSYIQLFSSILGYCSRALYSFKISAEL